MVAKGRPVIIEHTVVDTWAARYNIYLMKIEIDIEIDIEIEIHLQIYFVKEV